MKHQWRLGLSHHYKGALSKTATHQSRYTLATFQLKVVVRLFCYSNNVGKTRRWQTDTDKHRRFISKPISQPTTSNQSWRVLSTWSVNQNKILRNAAVYRVGQIKWHHFTFLLVTHECIHKILWYLAHINYIMQKMRWY